VLPVVAMVPLAVIPLAYWLEQERPTRRSLVGGVLAVAGVVGLARYS
jgi:drug/metabolite transporter (DMT)-like permease